MDKPATTNHNKVNTMTNDISEAKVQPWEEKLLESYHIEDDTNSTYCGHCKCRITIGRCAHGVTPPMTQEDVLAQAREAEEHQLAQEELRETDAMGIGWPGDGSGMDDLADYNANEADDYRDE